VGKLAGGVAHDFNNMLGVILGHVEMALDQGQADDSLFHHLDEIRKAAGRSADLTRQLLAFARRQTVIPRVLDLNDTVVGMLKMLRRLIGENVEFVWMPGHELWRVKIDPSQIDQILVNLVVNARDAISGVGRITIETANAVVRDVPVLDSPAVTPGEYVVITVSDNGCGMGREILDHIFEPFYTTKSVGKGTGLGLATVYGIVRQNEGFVDVESEPGRGTTFRIHLPRYLGKTDEGQGLSGAGPPPRGKETVLIVEDGDSVLRMTKAILEQLGYTALTADKPREALRLAEEYEGEIHLLITDVVMPEMEGKKLAGLLTSIRPRMKCLFMSGYTADVIAHHGIIEEGVNFIHKPFAVKGLALKIREILDERPTDGAPPGIC